MVNVWSEYTTEPARVVALLVPRARAKMPRLGMLVRRGARVDESTCLESMRPGNGTVGSNPTLSANKKC